jgi:hypothetical protein
LKEKKQRQEELARQKDVQSDTTEERTQLENKETSVREEIQKVEKPVRTLSHTKVLS